MKLSSAVKSISYLKARAPEVIRGVAKEKQPVVITVNGEAKAVLQDVVSYEEAREALALLKILALANKSVESGRFSPARESFARIRRRLKA
jgi:prevent-host-death family protein